MRSVVLKGKLICEAVCKSILMAMDKVCNSWAYLEYFTKALHPFFAEFAAITVLNLFRLLRALSFDLLLSLNGVLSITLIALRTFRLVAQGPKPA